MSKIEKRVYYGEYSLKHWINLMLKGNITLPKYQRSFVWEEKDVKRFIKSLKEKQFIQPITIAHNGENGKGINLILDGQQRLTSILLAYLGYVPIKDKFKQVEEYAVDENLEGPEDSENIDENPEEPENSENVDENPEEPKNSENQNANNKENNLTRKSIAWTFRDLLESDVFNINTDRLKENLKINTFYSRLDIEIDENFLEETFLGFSYVVPISDDSTLIQKFFSTLFRNINYFGMKLSSIESRRSLYYMDATKEMYFEGKVSENKNVLHDILILENMSPCIIDFVRYLSILSQYKAFVINSQTDPGKIFSVLKGYSSYKYRESYYADYVSYIVGLEQEGNTDKFSGFNFDDIFKNGDLEDRFKKLYDFIGEAKNYCFEDKNKKVFKSWIDADFWLFGSIYWIVFEGKEIEIKDSLKDAINEEIKKVKREESYTKSPNRLVNLRTRLASSITIYKTYIRNEENGE